MASCCTKFGELAVSCLGRKIHQHKRDEITGTTGMSVCCRKYLPGHGNEDAQYTMGGTVLNTTVKEKDLWLTISADMKVSEQCGIAVAKENQILGLIRRNIVYKEKELIIPLYKTIVRPHLEYRIQAWRPYRKKDIDMLERVQRRATKMIPKTQEY